ncbi:single-stranded DNA-binding protein WHY1, chloroplastic-like [Andrographis paniculata]|uniref:single-stranded DNA-binding protein WHY1, chloroplastic-like n=1 Tax=Andrographis paniculata TaxID=175694 RepID=UPI0021E91198|nr:single-stranded DNA-binding protein WHY1, chloroplastic-like [Andrographis paniculata]
MQNLNLPLIQKVGGFTVENLSNVSCFRFAIPTAVRFSKRKFAISSSIWDGKSSRNINVSVRSQYLTPEEQQYQQQKFPSHSSNFHSQPEKMPPRVYVGYTIYKGKAALTVEPRPPEFTPLDSGAFKLSKEGFVMLQFAPASGVRQYDWSRKQVFSLSVTEIGNVLSLGARDSFEFFHDPYKGKSDEGKVRKVLKVEPLPDGHGHFFNLSVQNKLINSDESIYIPITKAEFAVLVSSFNFIVPYLLGWHTFASSTKPEDPTRTNRSGAELEWNR